MKTSLSGSAVPDTRGIQPHSQNASWHLPLHFIRPISTVGRLGLGEPLLISASHGDGMADIARALVPHYEKWEQEQLQQQLEVRECSGEWGVRLSGGLNRSQELLGVE